jgi:hypothetical protein
MKNKNIFLFILVLLGLCILLSCIVGFLLWRSMDNAVSGLPNLMETAIAVSTQVSTAVPVENTAVPLPTSAPFMLGAAPVIHLSGRSDITIPPLGQPSDISLPSAAIRNRPGRWSASFWMMPFPMARHPQT